MGLTGIPGHSYGGCCAGSSAEKRDLCYNYHEEGKQNG